MTTGMLAVAVAACGTPGHKDQGAAPVQPAPFVPGPATSPENTPAAPEPAAPATTPAPAAESPSASGTPAPATSSRPPSRTPSRTPSSPAVPPQRTGSAPPATSAQPAAIPPPRVPMDIVRGTAAGPGTRTVALTFDDGPDPRWTPQVLDLLRAHGARATFCMVGPNAERHPELVRRVVAEGHRLCDHSVTHDLKIDTRSVAGVTAEIVPARDAIVRAAGGHAPVEWFRAPGGAWSPTVRAVSAGYGMKPLGWSVDTRDWEKPGADVIMENVRRELRPGGVILMHDAGGDRTQTVEALGRLLPWLKAQGYRITPPA